MLLTFDALVNVKQQMFVAAANSFLPLLSSFVLSEIPKQTNHAIVTHKFFFYFSSLFLYFCNFDYHCACCCFLNCRLETLKKFEVSCKFLVTSEICFSHFRYQRRKNICTECKGNCEFSEQRLTAITNVNWAF